MNRIRLYVAWVVLAPALHAAAQSTVNPQTPAPKSPERLAYESALKDYRRFQVTDIGDWKALNEKLRQRASAPSMPMPAAKGDAAAAPAGSKPMAPMDHGGMR